MTGLFDQIAEAAAAVRKKWNGEPKVGLILGTGLGGLASQIDVAVKLPYAELPHFPVSTVESHAGMLACGRLAGQTVVAMEGRHHFYEGYSLAQVTFPVRVMRALGCDTLILTSAAGGMNPEYRLADVVILDDHISLQPDNPLRGPNDDRLGPRFPDMCEPYDRTLIDLAARTASELSIPAHRGVFVSVPGPNLETRAEYRMLRRLGADVVGMSMVPEVIVAIHCGMRVTAFSIVTDLCLPNSLEPASIDKIIAVASEGGQRLGRLIPRMLEQLP